MPRSAEAPAAGPLHLDLRGLNCPLPVLRTRKAMGRVPVGGLVVVEATDPLAAVDIPHFCIEDGHALVARESDGPILRFTLRRGR